MANEKQLDLIDRKALGIGYCNPLVFDKIEYAHGWNCAIEILMKAPTVDAVEVIHSEWEITDVEHAYGTKCYHCPECGEDEWRHDKTNYCPNCGAKMDGDGNG